MREQDSEQYIDRLEAILEGGCASIKVLADALYRIAKSEIEYEPSGRYALYALCIAISMEMEEMEKAYQSRND